MKITANGKEETCDAQTHLPAFLEARGLDPARVVVERNGQALSPSDFADVLLEDGDRLEIVQIVAGG